MKLNAKCALMSTGVFAPSFAVSFDPLYDVKSIGEAVVFVGSGFITWARQTLVVQGVLALSSLGQSFCLFLPPIGALCVITSPPSPVLLAAELERFSAPGDVESGR